VTLPLISYPAKSSNHRVASFEVPGDEQPRPQTSSQIASKADVDEIITAAYRQIFNEQQMIASNRQKLLESQLRVGQITVRDFIRGLLLSDNFRRRNFDCNNNYRFAQMCVQRVLGRDTYSEREKIAWSIVIATKGIAGFVDELLNSSEYMDSFGYDIVPFQRRRILPQRAQGETTFAHMPRYAGDHLAQLKQLGNDFSANRYVPMAGRYTGLNPATLSKMGAGITVFFALFFSAILVGVILSWFGFVSI
jgi:phycobilisome rod-core linker protein